MESARPQLHAAGFWRRVLVRTAGSRSILLFDASSSREPGSSRRIKSEGMLRLKTLYFPTAHQASEANCRRQVTITTKAVVTNKTQGLTNQPR
jgi:hypothetical protein